MWDQGGGESRLGSVSGSVGVSARGVKPTNLTIWEVPKRECQWGGWVVGGFSPASARCRKRTRGSSGCGAAASW